MQVKPLSVRIFYTVNVSEKSYNNSIRRSHNHIVENTNVGLLIYCGIDYLQRVPVQA